MSLALTWYVWYSNDMSEGQSKTQTAPAGTPKKRGRPFTDQGAMAHVNFRVPVELLDRLKAEATKQGMTFPAFIRQSLGDAVHDYTEDAS